MDVQWSMIWTHSNKAAAISTKKRDAFADPLERPEWESLGWSVRMISRLIAAARPNSQKGRKIEEVERFTGAASAKPVCVS